MPFPSHIIIDGTSYPIHQRDQTQTLRGFQPFTIEEQPTVQQQADIAGSSRPAKTARPDILEWRWDNWSGGEGQTWVDASDETSFTRYYSSDLSVDLSVPGQISLGKVATSESTSIGTISAGASAPYLSTLGDNPWVYWDSSAKERTAANTWTSRTTNLTSAAVHQGIAAGQFLYIGSRSTGGKIIYINTATAGTTFAAPVSNNVLYVDGRLYSVTTSGSGTTAKTTLTRSPDLTPTATMTTVGVVPGYLGSGGLCAIGHTVYFLVSEAGQYPHIYKYDGTAMSLFATLPDGFRVASFDDNDMASLNGVLFIGGHTISGANKVATVNYYIPGGPSGTIGKLREGTNMRVSALLADKNNGLLIGTDTGNVFRYDMGTGGLSLYASGQSAGVLGGGLVNSMCEANGYQYFACRTADSSGTGEVYSTYVGTRPNETIVTGSKWDFLFPKEQKLLLKVTVQASIPSGCTVKFAFKADDGSTVTTDSVGAAMSMTSSDGGVKVFTISSASVERTFYQLQPLLYMDTDTGAASTNTPTVYAVTMEATTTGKQKFLSCLLDLSDQTSTNRPIPSQVTGSSLGATLEALTENSSNRIISVRVPFEKPGAPHPRRYDDYTCLIDEAQISYLSPGEGMAAVRFRVLA